MSYLGELRLIFAGRFQANVSTVNNDFTHFDNASFQPDFQKMQTSQAPNGWFNPQGDAAFRLLGCKITSGWTADGKVGATDPVLQCLVADGDTNVCGKLVDLDSQQQLVSEIWGLQVRITDPAGVSLLRGDYEPAAFLDIWDRATGGGGDIGAGATYQSILTNLVWGDVSPYPLLAKLRDAAANGRLSIKFNVDGMNLNFKSPEFMTGRLVGAIGPALDDEPVHMVLGRQFMAVAAAGGNFFTPAGGINYFPGRVDTAAKRLFLDLGNALPTTVPGGPMVDLSDLAITVASLPTPLGLVKADGADGYAADARWYETTAGIVSIPLTAEQLTAVSSSPLSVISTSAAISEAPSGAFVRADTFVYRMSPGDPAKVRVYASKFGQRLSGAALLASFDSSQLQGSPDPTQPQPVGTPTKALAFDNQTTTDATGVAVVSFKANDPGSPRWFNDGADYGIDGQIYGVRIAFADAALADGPVNQWNFISFLVWSGFTAANPVTWADVHPILQQYANLYPVMNRFLDLGNKDAVKTNAGLLKLSFGLDPSDPNAMPVTRDLSPAKRAAILAWLQNPIDSPVRMAAPRAAVAATHAEPPTTTQGGGKAAAAARRSIFR